MYLGQKVQYWGLERNLPVPIADWELDPKCKRMSEQNQPCLYGRSDFKQTVLLIGDSHAAHISQAVVNAAKMERWNAAVWTQGSCRVQFKQSVEGRVSDGCLRQNQEILSWVEENKPVAIIVSQFVQSDSSQSELRNAISKLHLIVPNVLLIENNPIFPDRKYFMSRLPLIMSPYKPPKEFAHSLMLTNDKKASDQLASWARNNGISTISFDSLFCNTKICTRWSDIGWLYRDWSHLSAKGSELTIPQLITFLKRF